MADGDDAVGAGKGAGDIAFEFQVVVEALPQAFATCIGRVEHRMRQRDHQGSLRHREQPAVFRFGVDQGAVPVGPEKGLERSIGKEFHDVGVAPQIGLPALVCQPRGQPLEIDIRSGEVGDNREKNFHGPPFLPAGLQARTRATPSV